MLSNGILGTRSNVRSECGRIKGEIYNGNKKGVTRTFLVMFLVMVGFGIIIPVIPFLAEKVGGSPTELGLLMAVYSLMQLFLPRYGDVYLTG